ncbi:MAG: cysteine hydrolase family protein [Pseudomonadota bacterium]
MATQTALLIIDAQIGIDEPAWGSRNNPDAEASIAALLQAFRDAELPVLHVQHDSTSPASPLRPGLPGHAFKPEALPLPAEPIFNKSVNSAFIGTDLEAYLRQHDLSSLIVAGFTTDHCVSTSVRMAANLGFEVTVISDATATHERRDSQGNHFPAQTMHDTALASLQSEFAHVTQAAEIVRQIKAR